MIHIGRYNGPILEIAPLNQTYKSKDELAKDGLPIKMKTRYGNTDLYKVTTINNIKNKTVEKTYLIFHFSYNNNFYFLRYGANKRHFRRYLDDVDYIFKNLEFKESS